MAFASSGAPGAGIQDLIARLRALSPKLAQASRWWWSIQRRCAPSPRRSANGLRPTYAAVIAHFAEATKPKLRQMPDEVTRLLADLVARRRQIVEMIAAETQRTRRMSDKRLTKSVARLRKALEKELSELDVLIDDQIRGSGDRVPVRFRPPALEIKSIC